MKNLKTLAIAGVLLLLVGTGVTAVVIKQGLSRRLSGPDITPSMSIETSNTSETVAVLTRESGDVKFKLPQETEYHAMTGDEINITSGTSVQTGDGLAHVLLPSNSVMSISEHAEVVVTFAEKSTSIKQLLGSTWHRVEKVLEGQSYEVETPNTLATVRGTEFNVAVADANNSDIFVVESETGVDVDDLDDPNDKPVLIAADQQAVLTGKNPPKVGKMSDQSKNSTWAKRNLTISAEIEKAENEVVPTQKPDEPKTDEPQEKDVKIRSVRKSILEKVKDDEDVKKIDENKRDRLERLEKNERLYKLSTPVPTREPEKTSERSLQNSKEPATGGTDKPTATLTPGTRDSIRANKTPTPTPRRENIQGVTDDKTQPSPTEKPRATLPPKEPTREPTKEPTPVQRVETKVEPTSPPPTQQIQRTETFKDDSFTFAR